MFTVGPSEEIYIIFSLGRAPRQVQNHVRYSLQIFPKNQSHKIVLQHYFEGPNNEYVNPFDELFCFIVIRLIKQRNTM